MGVGGVARRGVLSIVALAVVALGLTWVNLVADALLADAGTCRVGATGATGGTCSDGIWMLPVGIGLVAAGLGLFLWCRPRGGTHLLVLAWLALFGSLSVQLLRAALADPSASGFWLSGAAFGVMALTPLVLALLDDPRSLLDALLGDGAARRARPVPDGGRLVVGPQPDLDVVVVPGSDDTRARSSSAVSDRP